MRPFAWRRAGDAAEAVALAARGPGAHYLAGGTTELDLMKLEVLNPPALVDLGPLARRHGEIVADGRGLRLGALAKMSEVAAHPAVARDYPVIAETLREAASTQLRNMATLGGNVLQRTRCPYYRDIRWQACNKRAPGSGCAAMEGITRRHAILGASRACIATYPGDFAQALVALDAAVVVLGPDGPRRLRFEDLHRLPGDTPHLETNLRPGELIVAFEVPAGPFTRRSHFRKVRDRAAYDFALASAAVALDLDGRRVREARIAVGGVATKPWRSREAEAALKDRALDPDTALAAGRAAFRAAVTRDDNAFRAELGARAVAEALLAAAEREV